MARWLWSAAALATQLFASQLHADELACQRDDALSQAAASVLLDNAQLEAAQLTRAARAVGSDAVGLHALFVTGQTNERAQAWLRDLRAHSDSDLICGIADSANGRLLIASPQAGSLAPISLRERVVRGTLRSGFDKPELVLATADGVLTRVGATARDLERGIALPGELTLPIKVQLVARGPLGPRPVAERTLESGLPDGAASAASHPPAQPTAAASVNDSMNAASDDLSKLLIELRQARGRPRVRENRLLRAAATAHARRVCDEHRVAHELERGSGPEARLLEVGLTARLVGEAIARASNAGAALAALEQSPSHLLTLLEPRFTDVGIGRARDAVGKSCFVVLLCAWPRYRGH